jgi:cyclopropane fatty-acyl-phospholipid synthase-like methyltransferase
MRKYNLLSKGLKYKNTQRKWIETIALEAEKAISQLDATEQNYYRHAIAKILKRTLAIAIA